MRIKMFEGFGSEEYWVQIPWWDYVGMLTRKELKEVTMEERYATKLSRLGFTRYRRFSDEPLKMTLIRKNFWMVVTQSDDDYFYIDCKTDRVLSNIRHPYPLVSPSSPGRRKPGYAYAFKCDQFDGVLKFLKEKEIVKEI